MPKTRHRISGVIENDTPQHLIDHEWYGQFFELVGEDAKPIPAELVSTKHAERIAIDSKRADEKDKE